MTSYYVIPHVTAVTYLFIIQEIEIENQIKENKENENKMKIKY